jgi:hypothetical protein
MNYSAAPNGGIAASLGQATGYQTEITIAPKGRGIKPSAAGGGLGICWRTQTANSKQNGYFNLFGSGLSGLGSCQPWPRPPPVSPAARIPVQ